MADTFNARSQLSVGTQAYEFFHLDALSKRHALGKLPFSLKILLENLLRHEDGNTVTVDDIDELAAWDPRAAPQARAMARLRGDNVRTPALSAYL